MVTSTPIMGVPSAKIIRPGYKPDRIPPSGMNTAEGTHRTAMRRAVRLRSPRPSSGERAAPWHLDPHQSRTAPAKGVRYPVRPAAHDRAGDDQAAPALGSPLVHVPRGGGDGAHLGLRRGRRDHLGLRHDHLGLRHGRRWDRADPEDLVVQVDRAARVVCQGNQDVYQGNPDAYRGSQGNQDDKGGQRHSPRPPRSPCARATPRPTARKCPQARRGPAIKLVSPLYVWLEI